MMAVANLWPPTVAADAIRAAGNQVTRTQDKGVVETVGMETTIRMAIREMSLLQCRVQRSRLTGRTRARLQWTRFRETTEIVSSLRVTAMAALAWILAKLAWLLEGRQK